MSFASKLLECSVDIERIPKNDHHFTDDPYVTSASFSRGKLVREASLTQADMNEVAKCRRDHNRLGFAYQIGFAATVQPLPCAATVGNKRRVAELRGRADEYRLGADLRLRVVAAYGFGASGSYPAISRPAAL